MLFINKILKYSNKNKLIGQNYIEILTNFAIIYLK